MTTDQDAPAPFYCPRCGGLMYKPQGMRTIIIHRAKLPILPNNWRALNLLTEMPRISRRGSGLARKIPEALR